MWRQVCIALPLFIGLACAENNEPPQCNLPEEIINEIRSYHVVANRIIEEVTRGRFKGFAYNRLVELTDTIGPRVVGTEQLKNAEDYMLSLSRSKGLEVSTHEVKVPQFVRVEEEARLLTPRPIKLHILTLSGSIPAYDIEAPAVVVESFEDLDKTDVRGKIVVYNYAFTSYSACVKYRLRGAVEAAKRGARAAFVRSLTPFSLQTLHTGLMLYEEGVQRIPAAAISVEDSHLLARLAARGHNLTIFFRSNSVIDGTFSSRNVLVDHLGREQPGKYVVLSGHLDSWDVGTGAMDDADGVMATWAPLVILKEMGMVARRTVRNIMWTAEEIDAVGAKAYIQEHKNETGDVIFALESDSGVFTPRGIGFVGSQQARCIMKEIVSLASSLNATEVLDYIGVVDIQDWTALGVPSADLSTWNERYFWYHHSDADTVDVLDAGQMDQSTALLTVVSFVLADLSFDLPRD